jgi:hypothetical protein
MQATGKGKRQVEGQVQTRRLPVLFRSEKPGEWGIYFTECGINASGKTNVIELNAEEKPENHSA